MRAHNVLIAFLIMFFTFIIECESIKKFIKGLVLGALLSSKKDGGEHHTHTHIYHEYIPFESFE